MKLYIYQDGQLIGWYNESFEFIANEEQSDLIAGTVTVTPAMLVPFSVIELELIKKMANEANGQTDTSH